MNNSHHVIYKRAIFAFLCIRALLRPLLVGRSIAHLLPQREKKKKFFIVLEVLIYSYFLSSTLY